MEAMIYLDAAKDQQLVFEQVVTHLLLVYDLYRVLEESVLGERG